MSETLDLTLRVWRQPGADAVGQYVEYKLTGISTHMSFLEMLDVLNEQLHAKGEEMIAFDHDCREGICGMCSLMINGQAHGPDTGTTTCQLHMRRFKNGDTIEKGGFISVSTGNAPEANAIPVPAPVQETAMDAAACIGCGACVAACKNASAMLFVSAKVSHLSTLPQGKPERDSRVQNMVAQMDLEGFGNCTNTEECSAACPAEISVSNIARLNREYMRAKLCAKE